MATAGGKKVSFAAALAAAKPITKSIGVCLDGDLLAQADRLGEEYLAAQREDLLHRDDGLDYTPQAPAVTERLKALDEMLKAAEVEFVFRSIGRIPWQDLIALHPPTKAHRDLGADFNTDTFPVAAMAACCVSPEDADVEGFELLAGKVTDGQWNRLWATCHAANTTGGEAPNFAAAFATARPTATS
jgi:hypothetical protein